MKNIFDKETSFGNVTPFDKADAAELFLKGASVGVTTLGPNSYKVLIQTFGANDIELGNEDGSVGDNTYSTKDGHDVMRSIRFNNKMKQSIYNGSLETCKLNDNVSGDGTTSGYVFFANLFYNLYHRTYKDFVETKKLTNSELVSVLRRCVDLYAQMIIKRHGVVVRDYNKLIDIAKISLDNDDDLLAPIKNLLLNLEENKIDPSTVSISIEKSADYRTSFEVSHGYEIKAGALMKNIGDGKIDNVRVLIMNKPCDNEDITTGLKKLITVTKKHYEMTGEKVLVLIPAANSNYIDKVETVYNKMELQEDYSDRHLFVLPYGNSLLGVPFDNYLDDMMIYFGVKRFTDLTQFGLNKLGDEIIYDLEEQTKIAVNSIQNEMNEFTKNGGVMTDEFVKRIEELNKVCSDKVEEIKALDDYSFLYNFGIGKLKYAPLVSIDISSDYITHIFNMAQEEDNIKLRERCIAIHKAAMETVQPSEKNIYNKRLRNLIGKYSILYVGGTTDNERQSIMSQYKDATLAVNSAAKTGVVSGMNIPSMSVSQYILNIINEDIEPNFSEEATAILHILKAKEKYDFNDAINVSIVRSIVGCIHDAAHEIFYHILSNADYSDDEIKEIKNNLLVLDPINENFKPSLRAFNVITGDYTENVISPIESETSYIKAGITTCLEYLPARLFIHKDEWSINNDLK